MSHRLVGLILLAALAIDRAECRTSRSSLWCYPPDPSPSRPPCKRVPSRSSLTISNADGHDRNDERSNTWELTMFRAEHVGGR
jgi:hypothetical protein